MKKATVYAAIVLGSIATSVNATTIEPTVYVCSPTDEGEAELDNIVEIATTAAQQKKLYSTAKKGVQEGLYTDCHHEGGAKGYPEAKSVQVCKKYADEWYGQTGGALVIISCIAQ
ncbi:hypothetical protein N7379_22540 [Rhizobium pusense]|uniref:hypothetical protein n=1 Tax=Agrobacterium pusense TaxID=648995 RepID=UPI002448AF7C|nr:hypothetical protein [Agrobacterium pusense]MDH0117268.1 hypothetical protein [Agrobacterium pusense]